MCKILSIVSVTCCYRCRVYAMLRHVQNNCPKTSNSHQSCLNNVAKKMSNKAIYIIL